MNERPDSMPLNDFTRPLLEQLKRHPKRIVFPEGEDIRVLRVAERLVKEGAVAPILIGNRERIVKMAEDNGISMKFIRITTPLENSDFSLFCERYERAELMQGRKPENIEKLLEDPTRFACMMALYSQADAIVAGNIYGSSHVYRAVTQYRKHQEPNKPLFAISILIIDSYKEYGGNNIFFLADTEVSPVPTVESSAYCAVEASKFARHLLGRPIQTSMLSASTNGSAPGIPSDRVRAATVLAQTTIEQENLSAEIRIEGEIQVDAAINPAAYNLRVQHSLLRRSSDVLIFPTLDAADISKKLLNMIPGVQNYGFILQEVLFPVAHIGRMADEERIFGTTLAVANQAIQFHDLYPEGLASIY